MSILRACSTAYGGGGGAGAWKQMPRRFGSRSRGARVVGGGSVSSGGRKKGGDGRRGWSREGFVFLRDVSWMFCTYLCLKEHVAEPCLVSGPSMRPTIEHNSWLLINKMGGRGKALKRGQIVLVQSPLEAGRMVIKRITGIPGDSISVRPPAWDEHNSLGIERRLEVVPEGHVWLAGDNPDNSIDSRNHGSVPQALVEGVAVVRLWPFKDFGYLY